MKYKSALLSSFVLRNYVRYTPTLRGGTKEKKKPANLWPRATKAKHAKRKQKTKKMGNAAFYTLGFVISTLFSLPRNFMKTGGRTPNNIIALFMQALSVVVGRRGEKKKVPAPSGMCT